MLLLGGQEPIAVREYHRGVVLVPNRHEDSSNQAHQMSLAIPISVRNKPAN
jgi:hypothetical protein